MVADTAMLTQLADRMDKVLSLKQIMQQMTVNKMLHDGVVRDTQLASAPSRRWVGCVRLPWRALPRQTACPRLTFVARAAAQLPQAHPRVGRRSGFAHIRLTAGGASTLGTMRVP